LSGAVPLDERGLPRGYPLKPEYEITPREARHLLDAGKLVIVDVRTPEEWDLVHVAGSTLLPLNQVEKDFDDIEVPAGVAVATLCHHGVRSLKGALALRASGRPDLANVKSIAGGIELWSIAADPSVPRYERGPGVLRLIPSS
jgi:rhodanese-related sulfurtransferase